MLYERLEGQLSVKGQRVEFGFDIGSYWEKVAFTVSVEAEGSGVRVQVTDSDYDFKSFYFGQFA